MAHLQTAAQHCKWDEKRRKLGKDVRLDSIGISGRAVIFSLLTIWISFSNLKTLQSEWANHLSIRSICTWCFSDIAKSSARFLTILSRWIQSLFRRHSLSYLSNDYNSEKNNPNMSRGEHEVDRKSAKYCLRIASHKLERKKMRNIISRIE